MQTEVSWQCYIEIQPCHTPSGTRYSGRLPQQTLKVPEAKTGSGSSPTNLTVDSVTFPSSCFLKPLLRLNPLFSTELLSTDHCFSYSCPYTEVFQVGETVCQSHAYPHGKNKFWNCLSCHYLQRELRQPAETRCLCFRQCARTDSESTSLHWNCLTCNLFLGVYFSFQDHIPEKGKQNKKKPRFISCESVFNAAPMARWKTCFPFHLILIPQSTGCCPLRGVSGYSGQAGQKELMPDWTHKQYLCVWSMSPCDSYTKPAMGLFISQKEIIIAEIQNWRSDLWASICSVLTCRVIASN